MMESAVTTVNKVNLCAEKYFILFLLMCELGDNSSITENVNGIPYAIVIFFL